MNKNILVVIIIIVLILGGVVLAFTLNNKQVVNESDQSRNTLLEENEDVFRDTINTKYQYKDNVHTYAGSIELPNPCYDFTAEIVNSTDDDRKVIEINYIEPEEGVMCPMVIDEREFKVSTQDDHNKDDTYARVNGELYNLNIFEVDSEQDIDEFQIETKG